VVRCSGAFASEAAPVDALRGIRIVDVTALGSAAALLADKPVTEPPKMELAVFVP
jgi:hypothetical protein